MAKIIKKKNRLTKPFLHLSSLCVLCITAVVLGVIFSFVLHVTYADWVGPTANPPVSTVEPPVNISSVNQTKKGALALGCGSYCPEDASSNQFEVYSTKGEEILTIMNTGNTGVGISSPQEKLDINGAIKLGTTTNSNAGTIRWTGTDFEGYASSEWKSLTASGVAGNGDENYISKWTSEGASLTSSGIYEDSAGKVGIGVLPADLLAKLNVSDTDSTAVYAESKEGYGIHGVSAESAGVYGYTISGAYGGVMGSSVITYGVYGMSGSSYGIYGLSYEGSGVKGCYYDQGNATAKNCADLGTLSYAGYFEGKVSIANGDLDLGGNLNIDAGNLTLDEEKEVILSGGAANYSPVYLQYSESSDENCLRIKFEDIVVAQFGDTENDGNSCKPVCEQAGGKCRGSTYPECPDGWHKDDDYYCSSQPTCCMPGGDSYVPEVE